MDMKKPSLSFFAYLLRTEEKNLDYTIIRWRKADGSVFRHPGLTVRGITKYAYDLSEGKFVLLESSRMCSVTLEKKVSIVKKDDGGWIFWDRDGHRIDYTPEYFRKVCCLLFVNPALYE